MPLLAQRRALELAARHVLTGVARSRVDDPDCAPEAAQSYVAKKFSHCLSLYAPDKLPTGRRLREMMNSMVLCVEGWDDDPREIHSIPEVRRFYAAFHEAWPYWLYFCNLDRDTLKTMVLCRIPTSPDHAPGYCR